MKEEEEGGEGTYRAAGALLVARLARDLEVNIVGGLVLELDGGGREVVKVLVQQLQLLWLECLRNKNEA